VSGIEQVSKSIPRSPPQLYLRELEHCRFRPDGTSISPQLPVWPRLRAPLTLEVVL